MSRAAIAAETGLSRSAVTALVTELSDRGIAVQGAPERNRRPGRPSQSVWLRANGPTALAVDVGLDSLAVAIVALGGQIVATRRVDRAPGAADASAIAAQIAKLARALLPEAEQRGVTIVAAGVAVPGLVRTTNGLVALAPTLHWRDTPFTEQLQQRLKTALGLDIPVLAGNEADLGAIAEYTRGSGMGTRHLIYISGEVGVGGGVICDGRLLVGRAGFGGEVGHMAVKLTGRRCACGSTGCWETEAGEEALLRRAGRAEGLRRKALDGLIRDAQAGDAKMLAALESHGRWIGVGLANLANIFDPDRVVLGGIFARLFPFIENAIHKEMGRRSLAIDGAVSVLPAALGGYSTLLGAAEISLAGVLSDPTTYPNADVLEAGASVLGGDAAASRSAGTPVMASGGRRLTEPQQSSNKGCTSWLERFHMEGVAREAAELRTEGPEHHPRVH